MCYVGYVVFVKLTYFRIFTNLFAAMHNFVCCCFLEYTLTLSSLFPSSSATYASSLSLSHQSVVCLVFRNAFAVMCNVEFSVLGRIRLSTFVHNNFTLTSIIHEQSVHIALHSSL